MKKITTLLAVSATAVLFSSPAMAFHSGGVAECEGCHTMHNSYEGKAIENEGSATPLANQYQTGPFLLKANDQSGACLNCHENTPGSYHISTPGVAKHTGANATNPVTQYTPGGDFTWLKLTYSYSAYNTAGSEVSDGDRHGHNIIAQDYNYTEDEVQTVSPGGSYSPTQFFCSSCHDPHGRYRRTADNLTFTTTGKAIYSSGSYGGAPKTVNGVTYAIGAYRILGGNGYLPRSYKDQIGTGVTFNADPPLAIAPSSYNTSDTTLSGSVIVKYGIGMSEWCGNCHGLLVQNSGWTSGMGGLVHPVGAAAKLSQGYPNSVAANYNAYVTSGVMTGTSATAYTNLVPFETGDNTTAALKLQAALPVAGNSSQAMCLSCHRAHASGFSSMLRFDAGGTEFQTTLDSANNVSYPATDMAGASGTYGPKNMGRSVSDWQASYNGRPASVFGAYQRVLCNKCHAKD